MQYDSKNQAGFTVLELLVVISFLSIVIGLSAIFWLKPKDYGPQERNAQRWADVALLAKGLKAYAADNGKMPDSISSKNQVIGSDTKEGAVNLCKDLVPSYLKSMPLDPAAAKFNPRGCDGKTSNDYVTGYSVVKYVDGSVVLSAFLAENREQVTLRVVPPARP